MLKITEKVRNILNHHVCKQLSRILAGPRHICVESLLQHPHRLRYWNNVRSGRQFYPVGVSISDIQPSKYYNNRLLVRNGGLPVKVDKHVYDFGMTRVHENIRGRRNRDLGQTLLALSLLTMFSKDEDEPGGAFLWLKKAWKNAFGVSAAIPYEGTDEDDEVKSHHTMGRRRIFNFIADVLEDVQGAVVCIEVKDHTQANWFGVPQSASNGSGFIVKEDGLILTNAHVVASQLRCSITVKLQDGRSFVGYVEDVDYESDLATVRVKARGLPTLQLGCSSDTRIGEWVVAVGSPLNLSNTVTCGIISSTRRCANELGIHANDINYIQTDAAITFGNSGGPLINLDGEAIGINSMKVTAGISFAIPIDHAKKFLEKAEARRASGKINPKTPRRYMGLTILSLNDHIRNELAARTGDNIAPQGVFVWQVVRGGPAFLAGLQPGDVITSINGQQMITAAQVHEIVKRDDKLQLEVQRGPNKYTFTVFPEHLS